MSFNPDTPRHTASSLLAQFSASRTPQSRTRDNIVALTPSSIDLASQSTGEDDHVHERKSPASPSLQLSNQSPGDRSLRSQNSLPLWRRRELQDSPPSRKKIKLANVEKPLSAAAEIALKLNQKKDRFLVANRHLFSPLLPAKNRIHRLSGHERIADFKSLSQPVGVNATMKKYQLKGLSFLAWLYANGASGILADEMGLGKTLQTLAFLQNIKLQTNAATRLSNKVHLVVCPLSVLNTWITESAKFTPGLKILRLHGSTEERKSVKAILRNGQTHDIDVVLTSYECFQSEKSFFSRNCRFDCVILDEGHKIKNAQTGISKSLQHVRTNHRFLLTGTPLQNDMAELWSLLHWLFPEVFVNDTYSLFKESFDLSRGSINTGVFDDARKLLELIMLRRTKDSPEVDVLLPEKREISLFIPQTPQQRLCYLELISGASSAMSDTFSAEVNAMVKDNTSSKPELKAPQIGQKDGQSNHRFLYNLLMRLRQACVHPYLIFGVQPDPYVLGQHLIVASGKFVVLKKLLGELLFNQGRKVLIFSGFTGVLDCVEDLLHLIGGNGAEFRYLRLDGSTSRARRNLNMRLFQNSTEYCVMLLSTRAGGLGLNLTAANHSIFLDTDWNPQVDLQAEARTHRIGQAKPVTIWKLYIAGSVEEQMIRRVQKKLYLSVKVMNGIRSVHDTAHLQHTTGHTDDKIPELSENELRALIKRGTKTLTQPQIALSDMERWSFDDVVSNCQSVLDDDDDVETEEEVTAAERWLSSVEKVESRLFEGQQFQKKKQEKTESLVLDPSILRQRKATTVMVDGYAVSANSMNCTNGEAVPLMVRDSKPIEKTRTECAPFDHQKNCQTCAKAGANTKCAVCPLAYHSDCVIEVKDHFGKWRCPQHLCRKCSKSSASAGGLLFKCESCDVAFCEECMHWDRTTLLGDSLEKFELLNYSKNDQSFYIRCGDCNQDNAHTEEADESSAKLGKDLVVITDGSSDIDSDCVITSSRTLGSHSGSQSILPSTNSSTPSLNGSPTGMSSALKRKLSDEFTDVGEQEDVPLDTALIWPT